MPASGLKTWLAQELEKQLFVRDRLLDCFRSWSYEPIVIPTLVDLDLVEDSRETSFKVVDQDGGLLALRTDLSRPIAKAISSRVSELNFPLRLYYAAAVWRYNASHTDEAREIQQTGVELIASPEGSAELELIELLIESLAALGLKDWVLSLNHSSIWQAAFNKYPGLSREAFKYLQSSDLAAFRSSIPSQHPLGALLTSNIDELEAALGLDLSLIRTISKLSPQIVFDSSQPTDISFYTGLHFSLHCPGIGSHLAQGGRYDRLYPSFGAELPAIGFAFYMPALLAALNARSLIPNLSKTPSVEISASGDWAQILKQVKSAQKMGQRVKLCH